MDNFVWYTVIWWFYNHGLSDTLNACHHTMNFYSLEDAHSFMSFLSDNEDPDDIELQRTTFTEGIYKYDTIESTRGLW